MTKKKILSDFRKVLRAFQQKHSIDLAELCHEIEFLAAQIDFDAENYSEADLQRARERKQKAEITELELVRRRKN